jgi:HAD superfamily hydrolase (TIGR01509 family)
MPYKLVLFDLGNVIFDIDFSKQWRYLSAITGQSIDQISQYNLYGSTALQFERGDIDETSFRHYINDTIGYPLSYEQFLTAWNTIYGEPTDGINSLLQQLKPHYQLAVLSNTNGSHQKVWSVKYAPIIQHFDALFLSHEINAIKPEAKAYTSVLDALQLAANEVVFIDDKLENVEAAQKLGMYGVHKTSATQMHQDLQFLQIKKA